MSGQRVELLIVRSWWLWETDRDQKIHIHPHMCACIFVCTHTHSLSLPLFLVLSYHDILVARPLSRSLVLRFLNRVKRNPSL